MYYALSKVLPALILPLSMIFWGGIIAWVCFKKGKAKWGRGIVIGLAVLLYVSSLSPVAHYFQRSSQAEWTGVEPEGQREVTVVLGGFMISSEEHPTQLGGAVDRLFKAIELYNEGRTSQIIISGGNRPDSEYEPEAKLVREFVLKFELLPDSVMHIEPNSINTEENAQFTKALIDSLALSDSVFLVTSATHMTRAVKLFSDEGIHPEPAPTDFITIWEASAEFPWVLIPSPGALAYNSRLYREWMGVVYYELKRMVD